MDKRVLVGMILAAVVVLAGGVWWMTKPVAPADIPTQADLAVVADDYVAGNPQASVTLIEYLDFECPTCATYYPLVKQLIEEFKTDARIVQRYFPLAMHVNGMNSALAAEAAGRQGKYWEMHDLLFEKQDEWGEKSLPEQKIFETYATQLGLNLEQFKTDFKAPEVYARVNRDVVGGTKLGVSGTPTFFLNGQRIQNPKSLEDFRTLIRAAILQAPSPTQGDQPETVHEHMDILVVVDGKKVDLGQDKYQEKYPDIHFHDNNGEVVHKHKAGVTLGQLITSLAITPTEPIKLLVNGKETENWRDYQPQDLERLYISFGTNQSLTFSDQVTDKACIYSEKCPERGKPPTEKCVGGLGTDCTE